MKIYRLISFILLITLLAACAGSSNENELSNEDAISTIVAATLQANGTAQAASAEEEAPTGAEGATGSIAGALGYPSEGIPPLTVVAFEQGSDAWYAVNTEQNQTSYQIDNLPAGIYTVVAYPSDANFGGGYTQAVPCGLSADCSDHSLIPVQVSAGQISGGVDLTDWYGPDEFPANPAATEAETQSQNENVGYGEGTASISGSLNYPSEGIPPLTVAAFQVGGYDWYAVNTEQNQTSYQINNLPGGEYIVLAYVQDQDYAGGYTEAVPCGLSAECTNHELIFISVGVGEAVTGIGPADWYAGEDAFPKNPVLNQEMGIGKGYGIVQNAEEEEGIGSIAGSLSYPSSYIPAMQVTAFNIETGFWWYLLTVQNQSYYQLDDLPTGKYHVVAYPVGELEGGGYSAAVPCGLSADCSDHSLLDVQVKADEVTEGIDPGDWYAGPGVFPENPAP